MEGESTWAVTAGRTGVYFTPAPGNSGVTPPDARITAILPDGSELSPVLEPADALSGPVGFGFVFDPPLPDHTVVYMNDRPIHKVSDSARKS